MKRYSDLKKRRANPTRETILKVLKAIEEEEKPISITAISRQSKVGFYETKESVDLLYSLGILESFISSGNSTFFQIKRGVNYELKL